MGAAPPVEATLHASGVETYQYYSIERDEVRVAQARRLASQQAARSGHFDGVIALGCVIRGETPHFDYVCAETTRGLGQVGLQEALPVAFGLLTTDNLQQALQRSSDNADNKGEEAILTVLEMLKTLKNIAGGS
mgnify:CR=1 FL=1